MIGPGTGCAPFRAAIQERVSMNAFGNILFFGCRSKLSDYFFELEWNLLCSQGHLKLFTAFSRDQEQKHYVQHEIMQQAALIYDLIINQHAYCYIAGNAKQMPTDVMDALQAVVMAQGKLPQVASNKVLKDLESSKHLQLEIWN